MTNSTLSYLIAGGYAAPNQPGLHAFTFDGVTGALNLVGSYAGIHNPSFLVVHPNNQWLYSVSETGERSNDAPGAVWALKFQLEPWSMTPLNHQPSGGDWPCHLQLDKTGRWLFVANYGTGSARVFPIQADGSLGAATATVQHQGTGPNAQRQEGPHAHSTILTPDNQYALVADLGLDALVVYRFDSQAGTLTRAGEVRTRPGAGPRHTVFHPSGKVLYVANEIDNTVSAYEYDSAGTYTIRQTLATLPPTAPENTVADIHLASSANRLYISNRGHNSLAVYGIDKDGWLTRLAVPACGGEWPRNFALAPNGRFVLVANQYSNAITVLPLPIGAEEIGNPVAKVEVHQASCIKFLPANE